MTCEGCKASKVREKKTGWAGKEGGRGRGREMGRRGGAMTGGMEGGGDEKEEGQHARATR